MTIHHPKISQGTFSSMEVTREPLRTPQGSFGQSLQTVRGGWSCLPLVDFHVFYASWWSTGHFVFHSGLPTVVDCASLASSLTSCFATSEVSILSLKFPVEQKFSPRFTAPISAENRMRCANLPRDTSQNSLQGSSFDHCCRQYATLALLFENPGTN